MTIYSLFVIMYRFLESALLSLQIYIKQLENRGRFVDCIAPGKFKR